MKFKLLDASGKQIGPAVETPTWNEAIDIIQNTEDGPKYIWNPVDTMTHPRWDYEIRSEAGQSIHYRLKRKPK